MTDDDLPVLRRRLHVDLHVQDNRIVKVTSPLDSSVTDGHLCIKGRFGFEFVNERPKTRSQWGPRSRAAKRALLATARRATLATTWRDGRPRLVPVCFVILDDVVGTPLDENPRS